MGPYVLPLGLFQVYSTLVCVVHSVLCTVYTVMYIQFLVCLFDKHDWQSLNKIYVKMKFSTPNSVELKLKFHINFLFCLFPLIAREPSLVSFSISTQNHITVHGFPVGLHPWLVSGLQSPSYGT